MGVKGDFRNPFKYFTDGIFVSDEVNAIGKIKY
jgi:hypothetical protein